MLKKINQLLPDLPLAMALWILVVCGLAVVASTLMQPKYDYMQGIPHFESLIPKKFDKWHEVKDSTTQISVTPYQKGLLGQIYDEVLMRSYEDDAGNRIMLALAYAHEQKQEIKVHRPEVCYPAQGFEVIQMQPVVYSIPTNKSQIRGKELVVTDGSRYETVSYWIRMGNQYPNGGLQARYAVLTSGLLTRTVIDGVLVRVSMTSNNSKEKRFQFKLQNEFLLSLVNALDQKDQKWLIAID